MPKIIDAEELAKRQIEIIEDTISVRHLEGSNEHAVRVAHVFIHEFERANVTPQSIIEALRRESWYDVLLSNMNKNDAERFLNAAPYSWQEILVLTEAAQLSLDQIRIRV